jgi:hypothetical protein
MLVGVVVPTLKEVLRARRLTKQAYMRKTFSPVASNDSQSISPRSGPENQTPTSGNGLPVQQTATENLIQDQRPVDWDNDNSELEYVDHMEGVEAAATQDTHLT